MTAAADYEIEDKGCAVDTRIGLQRRIGALQEMLDQERRKNAKLERLANKWKKHVWQRWFARP